MKLPRLTMAPVPAVGRDGRYSAELAKLRGRNVSGVYALFLTATRECVYVGESHTGRLFETITRHFRAWKAPRRLPYANGRTSGGTTYDRAEISVAWVIVPARDAQVVQFAEISNLRPRDNEVTCESDRCTKREKAAAAAEWKPQPTDDDAPF